MKKNHRQNNRKDNKEGDNRIAEKKITKICKREYDLDKPLCKDDPEVQSAEYTGHYIDGVTYRVWSAFEGRTDPAESLAVLAFANTDKSISEFELNNVCYYLNDEDAARFKALFQKI